MGVDEGKNLSQRPLFLVRLFGRTEPLGAAPILIWNIRRTINDKIVFDVYKMFFWLSDVWHVLLSIDARARCGPVIHGFPKLIDKFRYTQLVAILQFIHK